jgi:hypothetical protein
MGHLPSIFAGLATQLPSLLNLFKGGAHRFTSSIVVLGDTCPVPSRRTVCQGDHNKTIFNADALRSGGTLVGGSI